MEEIKVGKYGLESKTVGMLARTTNGIIGIIINANEDEMMNGPELKVNEKIYCTERDSIKEIKENIIDLIEVGDYVNGEEVIDFYLDYYGENNSKHIRYGVITKYSNRYGNTLYIKQEQIKAILTHEQYNANCYKIEQK